MVQKVIYIQTASRLKQIPLFQERNVRIRIRILPIVQSADPHVRKSAFYP